MRWAITSGLCGAAGAWMVQAAGQTIDAKNLLVGQSAFVDDRTALLAEGPVVD